MQIHELNNYTGELDSGAFVAVDDGNDTGKVSVTGLLADTNAEIAQLDADLNGRIDNIIAGGTAPSEAEIIDARRGENGIDYASLGAAIRGQYSELNSEITKTAEYSDYANLFDKDNIITGKAIDASAGIGTATYNDLIDAPTLNVSNIIPVEAGNNYIGNSMFSGSSTRLYTYNSSGIYLGGINGTPDSDGNYIYSISGNMAFVRFEYVPSVCDADTYMFVKGNTLPAEYVPYGEYLSGGELYNVKQELLADIEMVDSKIDGLDIRNKLYRVANTIDDNGFTQGAYPDGSNGQIITNASWTTFWCSDYTPIIGGASYYYPSAIIYPRHLAFYDAEKNFVGGYESDSAPNPFTAPTDAAYVRFLVVSSSGRTAWDAWLNIINEAPEDTTTKYAFDKNTIFRADVDNPCDYNGDEITIFNKILCIGDSITAGTFNHNEGGSMQYEVDARYSYPTYLQKMCGVETYNAGVGGYTSVEWWNTRQHLLTSGYDCAIINLGINDSLESVSAEDTTTALENIINALRTANNNIPIFLATVVPAYSDGTDQFDAVNNTIRAVASDNNCYLIDLSEYSHARKATVSEAGHLTAWGYYQLAKDYISAISYIMSKNRSAFKFVQFIGTTYSYSV